MTQKELNYIEDIHKVETLISNMIDTYLDCDLSNKSLDLLKMQLKEHVNTIDDLCELLGDA